MEGEVRVVVWAESVVGDEMLIVSSLIVDGGLGPTCLVIPVVDFKQLANRSSNDGVPIYSAEFGMRPRSDSKWLPWLVPTARLSVRFGVAVEAPVEALPEPRRECRSDLGYLRVDSVTRRLAAVGYFNTF